MSVRLLFAAFLLALVLPSQAEEVTKEVIPVTEAAKIEAQLDKKATIRGKVTRTGRSKAGLQFLNFSNGQFVVVCFPDGVASFTKGEPADLFKDKTVEVTGKIEKYRNSFQIKLASPEQIKIIAPEAETAPASPEKEAPVEKKPKKKEASASDGKPVDPKKFFDC